MAESKGKSAATVKDCSAPDFIKAFAEHLKKAGKIELPEWHDMVKTAPFKELAPIDPDWYYIRAASLARKVYLHPGMGVGGYTRVYGGRQYNDGRPEKFGHAARGIIRHILQQLQEIDIVAKRKDRKGRFITKNGQHELDVIAAQVAAKAAKSALE